MVTGYAGSFAKVIFWRVTTEVVGGLSWKVGAALHNRSGGRRLFARDVGQVIGTA